MAHRSPAHPEAVVDLAMAVIASSNEPVLLLDGDLKVVAASASFFRTFQVDPATATGLSIFELGEGEWNTPRLKSLLHATVSGQAEIESYEMDLRTKRKGERRVMLNAHKLAYAAGLADIRLVLAVSDITAVRAAEKMQADLLREKAILLQEIQHRVANSLQIIASVLMQSARKVQSEETRIHLRDAHTRVMSVAALQQQLAQSRLGDVSLRPYLVQLCESIGASMIRDHDQLTLEVLVDDSATSAEVSVSLGLIVTELVINALKHAFPGGRKGRIVVDYQSNDAGWTLSVVDDGVGMPDDAASRTPGLGTSIVEALAKQLHATVEVAARNPGTGVSITHIGAGAAVNDADEAIVEDVLEQALTGPA